MENVDFMILVGLHIGHACKLNGENVMLVELLGVEATVFNHVCWVRAQIYVQ